MIVPGWIVICDDPDKQFQRAETRGKARRMQNSEWLYRTILESQPTHPDANFNLGVLEVAGGRIQAGLAFLKTAVEADPGEGKYWLVYIDALLKAGQADDARQVLTLGRERGLKGKAVDDLERRLNKSAPKIEPISRQDQTIRTRLSTVPKRQEIDRTVELYRRGEFRAAETKARDLLRDFPEVLMLHDVLGAALYGQGRLEEAVESCRKALEISPDYTRALNNLGAYLREMGRGAEAVEVLERALEKEPMFAEAHNNLANAFRDLGRLNEAAASFGKAAAIDPGDAATHRNLGVVQRDLGRLDEAVASYQRALKINPGDAEVRYLAAALSGETPRTAPDEYVARLFDEYAGKFDEHLVDHLDYQTPKRIRELVLEASPGIDNFGQVIDLGCGTGLGGAEFRPFSSYLCGVDLSKKMLLQAKKKNIYDELAQSNITDYLQKTPKFFDLFLSMDVFVYLGDLEPIFAAIFDRAVPAAKVAFSVEKDDGDEFRLLPSGRYAHSETYIRGVAEKFGFRTLALRDTILREDKKTPIHGQIFVLEMAAFRP